MLKLSQPITSINGFKIGNRVRLKDGDGRSHIIKSFSIDGLKEFFFEVQFEDGTETMLDNIALLPSNLDNAAEEYAENILAGGEDMFDAIADGFKAGAEWMTGQGITVECGVRVYPTLDGVAHRWVSLYKNGINIDSLKDIPRLKSLGFKDDDEAIVQIRKK